VIVVLLASLVECFLILPNHMAHALPIPRRSIGTTCPRGVVNRGFEWVRERGFRPLMAWVIWARYPVLAAMILVLASAGRCAVPARRRDLALLQRARISSVSGNFAMLDGATRDDSMEMMREMQRAVDAVAARLEASMGATLSPMSGRDRRQHRGGLSGADTKDADLLGSIAIELIDADLRPYSSFAFVARVCRTRCGAFRCRRRSASAAGAAGRAATPSTCRSSAPMPRR
jgi:hypothetical protein